eukprot:8000383-Prorocentrum_lima.AAC.1
MQRRHRRGKHGEIYGLVYASSEKHGFVGGERHSFPPHYERVSLHHGANKGCGTSDIRQCNRGA